VAVDEITIKSLEDFLAAISGRNDFYTRDIVFRGQSDASWEVKSTAYRRLEKYDPEWREYSKDMIPDKLLEYSETLMARARRYRGGEFDEHICDLPLLAKLRHRGAATILIDFTRSAMTALWFACQDDKTDGKVFCLRFNPITSTPLKITHKNEREDLSKLFKCLEGILEDGEIGIRTPWKIATWEPPLDNRILKQDSFFIFNREGGLAESRCKEIIVDRGSKADILKQLKELHNLSEVDILPDFYGFAQNNNSNKPYGPQTAPEIFAVAERYRRKNNKDKDDYKSAIKFYSQAIKLDERFIPAYIGRGDMKSALELYDEAIVDFEKAIELADVMDLNTSGDHEFQLGYKSSAYFGLSSVNEKQGLYGDAQRYRVKARKLEYQMWGVPDDYQSGPDISEFIDIDDESA